jgi:hypothetical protein
MNYMLKISITLLACLILLCGCARGQGGKKKGDTGKNDSVVVSPHINAINVYLENSGSMDGYVNGVTEFKQTIYSYLTDIAISDITQQLNLFYINNRIIRYGSDVSNFIQNLTPATFRQRGGNRGTSDIANVIDLVLSNVERNTVAILITDGIFSPRRGINANQYLVNQQIAIRNSMAQYLRNNTNAAVVVYQLSSLFDGNYYDRNNSSRRINEQRPFYIWLIGDVEQMRELRRKVPDSKFIGGGVKNVFSITAGDKSVNYAVRQGSGEFRLDRRDPRNTIVNLQRTGRGRNAGNAIFSVNANLSGFLLDDNYLTDVSNYELNDRDFTLSSVTRGTNSYSHLLNLSSPIIRRNISLSVKLLSKVPQWVEDVNDDVGLAPVAGTTYGIKYQIQGLYEAFTIQSNYYTEITINIR